MIATDLTINVYFVTIAPFIDVLVDVNGHILEFQVFTRAVRPWIGGRREYISGAAYLKAALKWLGQRRLKKLGIAFPIRGQQSKPIDGPYQLVTPALRGRKNVVLREENILQPAGGDRAVTADVIRLGNIMQTVYFSPQQMRTIARHIVERCRGDNGVIVLCRNAPDGDIHASILRMERGGVPKVEARLGCGSEAEQYFLDVGAFAD